MAVAGLRGTGDWGADERPKNFRESILRMNPQGDTPLTALLGKVGTKPVDDPEFSWWAEPSDIVRLVVAAAIGTAETLITVTADDPTATNIKKNWSKATHLVPGDILQAEKQADQATFNPELMVVTAVHSETQFSVQRGAFGTTPADLTVSSFHGTLLKIGTAFGEGTGAPQSATRNPVKWKNYTQIWKTTYEGTNTAKATKTRTGNNLDEDRRRKAFDHARDIEFSLLFGQPWEGIDPTNGKPKRTTGGIRYMIPQANTKIFTTGWGLAKSAAAGNNFLDAISPIFDYNTPAGDTRIALCGNGALNALNKALTSGSGVSSNITLNMELSSKVYGMNFRELSFPQGRILLRTHPLLSRHPIYSYSMWLMDFSCIKWRPLTGRDTKFMDNVQDKDEDVTRGLWLTEAGLMVDMGGQTLGYIGGLDSAPA